VAKSHKLVIAVALLAGGYGLALVWNATVNFFWPAGSLGAIPDAHAFLPTGSTTATALVPPGAARLVPDSQVGQSLTALTSSSSTSAANDLPNLSPRAEQPTWLSAGPPAQLVSASSEAANQASTSCQSPAAVAPAVASTETIVQDPHPPEFATLSPLTTARITQVKPVQDLPAANGSPWDRWPEWKPATPAASTTASGPQTNPVVTASAAEPINPPPGPSAVQVSFTSPSPEDGPASRLQVVVQEAASEDDDGPRTHTIIDGDSLAKLAERFLGDARLSDEIYQANRDVLKSPDLLPIGVDIKLPPRPFAQAAPAPPTHDAPVAATSNSPGPVPVSDVRKAFVGIPRAQLLRPLPPVENSNPPPASAAYAASKP
jgi:nucleoid-associated protein YgaU